MSSLGPLLFGKVPLKKGPALFPNGPELIFGHGIVIERLIDHCPYFYIGVQKSHHDDIHY